MLITLDANIFAVSIFMSIFVKNIFDMDKEAIKLLNNEKSRIEKEIEDFSIKLKSLNEELVAINIVLSRHSNDIVTKPAFERTKFYDKRISNDSLTKSEKRVIDALIALGGRGNVNDIFNYLKDIYPKEDESRLRSSVRQFSSSMSIAGKIGADKSGGNRGSIYYIKNKNNWFVWLIIKCPKLNYNSNSVVYND